MSLEKFFYPKSIAIMGASNKPGKVGYTLAKKIYKFPGKKYLINIEGYKIGPVQTYRRLNDIKDDINLLVIAIPAFGVKQVMLDAAKKKIKNVILISAGFAEAGRKELEQEILYIAKKNKIRILGPNDFGIVNTSNNLDCTFAKLSPKKGPIAFISQSGALWSTMADYSVKYNIGFSKFISLGDMLDIDFNEALNYLNKDKETKAILLYIESLRDGKGFMESIKKSKKPVIVIKAGKTSQGATAVHSHTGSLAGSYEIYKAASKQAGAIFIETLTEALDIIKFLQMQNIPKSKKTLIITNAGGPAVLLTDYLIENKIELVKIPKNIKFNLPKEANINNPIDVLGDGKSDRFREIFNKIKNEKSYDIVIIILTPQDMTNHIQIAEEIAKFKHSTKKTIIACFMAPDSFDYITKYLEQNKIPVYLELERIAKLLGNLNI